MVAVLWHLEKAEKAKEKNGRRIVRHKSGLLRIQEGALDVLRDLSKIFK